MVPLKRRWNGKNICKKALWHKENECWQQRLSLCSDSDRFKQIHTSVSPSVLWKVASVHPKSLTEFAYVAKLCTRTKISSFCNICAKSYNDDLYHFAFECIDDNNTIHRIQFQNKLRSVLKDDTLDFIMSLPLDFIFLSMLGGNSDFLSACLERFEYERLLLLSSQFLSKIVLFAEE